MSRGAPYQVVVTAAAVLALAVLVVAWLSQPSRARAPTTTSTPVDGTAVSTTAGPEPTSTVTTATLTPVAVTAQPPADSATPPVTPTAVTPTPLVIAPSLPRPGPSPLGRSQVNSDPAYYADVLSYQFTGTVFNVQIEAAGRPGMAPPLDSCLSHEFGGRIRASRFVASVSRPEGYAGYLEFPAGQLHADVSYFFSYGCAYSQVPLGVLIGR